MSDQIRPVENVPRCIESVNGVSAAVETDCIEWHADLGDGQIDVGQSSNQVRIHVRRIGSNEETDCSVGVYLQPDEALTVASELRESRSYQRNVGRCTMWLNIGWLHHEGPVPEDETTTGVIELTAPGQLSLSLVQETDEHTSRADTSTRLSNGEREWLADQLESAAEEAEEWVSPVEIESNRTTRDRIINIATSAAPVFTAAGIGILFGSAGVYMMGVLDISQVPAAALSNLSTLVIGSTILIMVAIFFMTINGGDILAGGRS